MNYEGKTFGEVKVIKKIELEGFVYNGYYLCEKDGKTVRLSEKELKVYVDKNPIKVEPKVKSSKRKVKVAKNESSETV